MTNTSRADCHAHIVTPRAFAYTNGPGYKPRPDETGDRDRFLDTLDAHAMSHALLVQPSCYGCDNACMLDAMARSQGRFKGIAVVAPQASDKEWERLKERGVVGVRLNLMRSDAEALSRPDSSRFLTRVKELGWFLQIYATGQRWCDIEHILLRSGVRLVIDHFGEPDPSHGLHQPGFQAVLALGRETGAIVKLSAPFRASAQPFPHSDVEPFVGAIMDVFGVDRCIWGSDWPFMNTTRQVEYGNLLNLLPAGCRTQRIDTGCSGITPLDSSGLQRAVKRRLGRRCPEMADDMRGWIPRTTMARAKRRNPSHQDTVSQRCVFGRKGAEQ
jgi:predicted TIM-barrel fold metal-dependent hydrolase